MEGARGISAGEIKKIKLFYYLGNHFSKKHLRKLYISLYESVLGYGIIHWGASCHLQQIQMLQNRVCRNILHLQRRTPRNEIYLKMQVMDMKRLHKYRLLLFVFKHSADFQIKKSDTATRSGSARLAKDPGWNKFHSRSQARYQGFLKFNNLSPTCRNEKQISAYKKRLKQTM